MFIHITSLSILLKDIKKIQGRGMPSQAYTIEHRCQLVRKLSVVLNLFESISPSDKISPNFLL